MELETEIGDKLLNNDKATELIISTLEKIFGVNKKADLLQSFNKFIGTVCGSSQDLVSYVAAFETSYNEFKKLGKLSLDVFLSLFLMSSANILDTDFQIITANIDFNNAKEKNINVLDEAKTALKGHQYCKAANTKPFKKLLADTRVFLQS